MLPTAATCTHAAWLPATPHGSSCYFGCCLLIWPTAVLRWLEMLNTIHQFIMRKLRMKSLPALPAASSAGPLPLPLHQIRLEMLNIKQRMGELRGMHGRATLSRFDDTNEDELQVGSGSPLLGLFWAGTLPYDNCTLGVAHALAAACPHAPPPAWLSPAD